MPSKKPQKINLTSANLDQEKLTELHRILPDVFIENKVDFDKLRTVLGDEIELGPEKFTFSWAGKTNAIKNVLIPSKLTLNPKVDEGIKWDESENIFIEGDNLEVLKLLQKAYFEKVKMIYIDPPYNTGHDFVYNDDFNSPLESYLKQTGQKDDAGSTLTTNLESNGRYHSDWLSMMYPRLKLAWNLLQDDGIIFISIDDNEIHHLRMIMDEIFGEQNFIDQFSLRTNPRGNQAKKFTASTHEYVVAYFKNSEHGKALGIDIDEEIFTKVDDDGNTYREIGLRKRGAGSRRVDAPNQYYPIYFNPQSNEIKTKNKAQGDVAIVPKLSDGTDGRWRWASATVDDNKDSLIVRLVNRNGGQEYDVFEKDYYSDDKISKIKSIFYEKDVNYENASDELKEIFGAKLFSYPKPVYTIKKLIESARFKEGIVLDFFAGSATTAHAVLKLNKEDGGQRKFILVQLPEQLDPKSDAYKAGYKTIAELAKDRIVKVINGFGSNPEPLADGFKVFNLSQSNYPENNFLFDPEKTEKENHDNYLIYLNQAQQQHLFGKNDDGSIIYENIVKEGYTLNSKLTILTFGSNKVHYVSEGSRDMYICLDAKLSPELIKEFTNDSHKGHTLICLESSLDDTSAANLSLNVELKTI